ncbi:MAG: thioredoxin family protein, partial [Flammeovirgaceae bacterium]|nr:thioredoxin family protein [Flammeovirgaceae bacterium]MDW8286684.1 thioredoxin family protein [Flammeovirgaceae bacterium]
ISPKKKYDEVWGGEYTYFVEKAKFIQLVRVKQTDVQIKVRVTYQVCTDVTGRCVPLEEEFSFSKWNVTQRENLENSMVDSAKNTPYKTVSTIKNSSYSSSGLNYRLFMIEAFLLGLLAIFTPCVFPMIPLTVSFFTQKGKIHALFYGFSIILIYTLIGTILAPLLGSSFANALSTHWLPNLIFFVIFIVFALSFFGMFELVLPSSWVNKADAQADKGGWVGIFFMAFTLVLVSFSCTGPLVGSLLVASAGGEILQPIAGMFSFAFAFSLPFTLFAFFPSLLLRLPKSGGWLQTIKVTLGFIELAFAFKFLSMIDLVYHLRILDREIMIAIWAAIALFMGLYYLGKIPLPHHEEVRQISVPRMLMALACFTFLIYLLPGMFGAPLKALSGILPPSTTHDFNLLQILQPHQSPHGKTVKYGNMFRLPHGLQGYFDYEEGLSAAQQAQKPVFLDFTGHGCANCRKMEDNVWAEPTVFPMLSQDFVIVSLYVDDRTPLPATEWITTPEGKILKTIGAVNMWLQASRFNTNAQPFYALLDEHGELLIEKTLGYEPDPQKFAQFLREGKEAFRLRRKNS